MHRSFLAISATALLLLSSSCVLRSEQPVRWRGDSPELVWPVPPAQPRIKYLRSLHGSADFSSNNVGTTFFRWLSGEKDKNFALSVPFGVAADGDGRVWVTDPPQRTIFCFDLRREKVSILQVLSGRYLMSPTGISYDPVKDILSVADSALNTVFVFTPDGTLLGERVPEGGYGRPGGVAFDADSTLYVADVTRHQVVKFAADGSFLGVIKGQAAPEHGFNSPVHLAVDTEQQLYVTDSMNFRVEKFDEVGKSLSVFGKIGDVPGSFARPRGVAIDSERHLYVADALLDNVQIFNQEGQLLLAFGKTGTERGEFSLPAGLFIDRHNRLYVVDSYNQRIQIFTYLTD
ncbi:MAG: SMP-30/gluconolactonase/LRE family protein [Desulfuromonadaceae bacterium]|nr:SMP-30/gluconolactonase/LRE family protein [Desulfuromonadaceae bacterium]